MRASVAQSEALFKSVGKLAIRWNDLDLQLRRLAYSLTDDWFTVAILTADLQTANLIQAIRLLAKEYDVESTKLNNFLDEARPKTGHHIRARDMIFDHVDCALTCADRLRLYRNLYIHCIISPTAYHPSGFILGGMTTRSNGRLSDYEFPLKIREINKVTTAIYHAVNYAAHIEYCIKLNQDIDRKSAPRWPKKLIPYAQLKKPYSALTDRMPLF